MSNKDVEPSMPIDLPDAATVAALDVLLEELTAALVAITERRGPKQALLHGGDWAVRYHGGQTALTLHLQARPDLPAASHPNDYQLALVYRSHLERWGPAHEAPQFLVEYTLRKPHRWEEQALRELALESIALLVYVFGCPPGALRLERR
ncbi:MAG: hypothetical protein IT304_04780 [Dehalococcoidia bacterium]|nr:hypothetical protein [Dehalococcoidia bacterium]